MVQINSLSDLLTFRMAVEIIRPHVLAEHDIIIEVDELLRESWDSVNVSLYGRRTECRQVGLVLKKVLRDKRQQQQDTQDFVSYCRFYINTPNSSNRMHYSTH